MFSRRHILKVGAASIVVTGLSAGYFAATRRPGKALQPWGSKAHMYDDIRLKALSYAILAPNPHNRQPWLADVTEKDTVKIYCDLDRRLPETDPYDRQITIGLGCFLGLFEMAANQLGHNATIELFPTGEPFPRLNEKLIAKIKLSKDNSAAQNPLFHYIKQRRSNKKSYDTSRQVSPNTLNALVNINVTDCFIEGTIAEAMVADFRDLTRRAHEIETFTPRTLQESIDLMRIGKAEINNNPDGVALGGAMMEALAHAGVLTREQMADQTSKAFQQGLDMYKDLMSSAMGYVWVTTQDNSRRSQINAGRAWVAINLTAAKHNIGIHPLSQALQEYSEMKPLFAELHEKLAVEAPSRIQMFGRIGYAPKADPAPRRNMESRLIKRG